MLRLGLTGGVGSGKSTVARELQSLGAALIDADAISRQCTLANGSAMPAIARQFGPHFVTPAGAMDRNRMREHVFAHPEARQALEAIVHPLVQQEIRRQSDLAQSPCLVFDIPLLVESPHWRHQLDRILIVDCTEETQIRRVQARNGWERVAVEAVIRQQSAREHRLAAADGVLWNDGVDLQVLRHEVQRMAARLGL
ncbi:dephospho-CoA kinase [Hydrogenophaga sp. SL48]|uniref:dephospho-CoA kinase n=1 Tax=Hydrogenophaga sp. SL48 TaxID=2806347 RepID=UPI001EEE2064|nr:dephospho-CoA kinase [Hydrogenophaga sp. SL48]UJW81469.1 dephospho-CoA kinase [Hydrogenophaga sp. SL48]